MTIPMLFPTQQLALNFSVSIPDLELNFFWFSKYHSMLLHFIQEFDFVIRSQIILHLIHSLNY